MKKKLTAMVLALGAMFGAFEAGAALAGNGTKADPYRIGSYGDLVAFAAKVNGGLQSAGVFFGILAGQKSVIVCKNHDIAPFRKQIERWKAKR